MVKSRIISSLKRDWHWTGYLNIILSASFSLAVLVRFLDFFLTPTLNKILVFIILLIYFLFLSLFFLTPILKHFIHHPKILIGSVLISIIIATVVIFVLPYQNIPIRTEHRLMIRVLDDSSPVLLEDWEGDYGNPVSLEEMSITGDIQESAVFLPAGGGLEYVRVMTGGLNFNLTAPKGDAYLIAEWDGVEQEIHVPAGASKSITTDATSLGSPTTAIRYFLLAIKFNEWLGLTLVLCLVLGTVHLVLIDQTTKYEISFSEVQRFLSDYLILSGVLILFAALVRNFFPTFVVANVVILAPGLVYLILKVLQIYFPRMPLIVIILTLGINIAANFTWFDRLLSVKHLLDKSFNQLAITVNPSEPTLMSIGFYKQLRGTELVVAPGSFFAEEANINRLVRIDYVDVSVFNFPDSLSQDEKQRILSLPGWTEWDKRVQGAYYFYLADSPFDSPIAIFTYRDDVFLVPIEYTDDLGLFHDFVLD